MPARKLPPNDVVIAEYKSGLSTGEIAKKHNVRPVTVVSLLRRLGVKRRTNSEAQKLRFKKTPAVSYWKGKTQPAEMVEKRISQIRGKNHWSWKGGQHRRPYRKAVDKIACNRCGVKDNLGVHHIDNDHYNDAPDNLEVLCVSCHMSHHKTEYWKAKRKGKTPSKSNGPVGWKRNKKT